MIQNYKRAVDTLTKAWGHKPARREIAVCMGLTDQQVEDIESLSLLEQMASIDAPLTEDEGGETLGGILPGNEEFENSVIENTLQSDLTAILWPLVDALPDDQSYILRQRYQEKRNYTSIALDMDIDLGRTRRIEYKALRKLRFSRQSRRLRSFLTEYEEIYSKGIVGNGAERFNTTWESSTERVALRGLL